MKITYNDVESMLDGGYGSDQAVVRLKKRQLAASK